MARQLEEGASWPVKISLPARCREEAVNKLILDIASREVPTDSPEPLLQVLHLQFALPRLPPCLLPPLITGSHLNKAI